MTIDEVLDRFKAAGCTCECGWAWDKWETEIQFFPDDPLRHFAFVDLKGDFSCMGDYVQVVITEGTAAVGYLLGEGTISVGYLSPASWFADLEEQLTKASLPEPPRQPFVTELDLMGVSCFQNLVSRMENARKQDAEEYDEYDHPGSPYSDAVLAQAVMYLTLSLKDERLLEQTRTLIQTYQAAPLMPDLDNARKIALEQVTLHQKI